MVKIFIGNQNEFELISYVSEAKTTLKFTLNPGTKTLAEMVTLLQNNTEDIIIKNDDVVVARYANFNVIVSIDQKYESGSTQMTCVLEHPTDETRFQQIEANLSTATGRIDSVDTNINQIHTSLNTVTGDVNTAKTNISNLQTNMNTAQVDINQAKSDITDVQNDMSVAQEDIETVTNSDAEAHENITSLQNELATTQDALDYLIMK